MSSSLLPDLPPDGSPQDPQISALTSSSVADVCTFWQALGYTALRTTPTKHGVRLHMNGPTAQRRCPMCGSDKLTLPAPSDALIADIPVDGMQVVLAVRFQPGYCRSCIDTFHSPLPGIDLDQYLSERLARWLAARPHQGIIEVVQQTGARLSVVRRILQQTAEDRHGRRPGAPDGFQPIPGIEVAHHVHSPRGYDLYVHSTVGSFRCPECDSDDVIWTHTHARVVHDRPLRGERVDLVFTRYRNFHCICGRGFHEPLPGVADSPRNPRLTTRAQAWIVEQGGVRPEQDIANDFGVLPGTIHRVLVEHGGEMGAVVPQEVPVAGWEPLPDMVISRYVRGPDRHNIYAQARPTMSVCPHCGTRGMEAHWRHSRAIRDLPLEGLPVTLHYRSIVYKCGTCRRSTPQPMLGIDPLFKTTGRLAQWLVEQAPSASPEDLAHKSGLRVAVVTGVVRTVQARQLLATATVASPRRLALPGYTVHRCTVADGIEHAFLTPDKLVLVCPHCFSRSMVPRRSREHSVRDVPSLGHPVLLHIEQPIMYCSDCGNETTTPLPYVDLRRRVTERLGQWLHDELRTHKRADVAARIGVPISWLDTIARVAGKRRSPP